MPGATSSVLVSDAPCYLVAMPFAMDAPANHAAVHRNLLQASVGRRVHRGWDSKNRRRSQGVVVNPVGWVRDPKRTSLLVLYNSETSQTGEHFLDHFQLILG